MRRDLDSLRDGSREIAWALRRRGLEWVGGNAEHELVFAGANLTANELDELYRQMHSYAFRLFLRDIIHHRTGFGVPDLLRYVDEETARRYAQLAGDWRLIEPMDSGTWRLSSQGTRSFGETLEWYVAQLFTREFGCPAAWGVRATLSGQGGDYDVLSMVEGRLVCVEVKSSPPKHITVETLEHYLKRVDALGPAMSIFLEDTHLRLEDKIVPMFVEAVSKHRGAGSAELVAERRHLYTIRPTDGADHGSGPGPVHVVASAQPSLESNVAFCLRRLLVPEAGPSLPTN